MKIGGILGVTVILVLIFLYQWPKLKKNGRKVKMAFFLLMLLNWVLAVLLVIFPEMPGPGQLIDFIYKSFEPFW
jgi:multisubunit Na+/H+ antiporter MnhB subunit